MVVNFSALYLGYKGHFLNIYIDIHPQALYDRVEYAFRLGDFIFSK